MQTGMIFGNGIKGNLNKNINKGKISQSKRNTPFCRHTN
jgi:hypothetical protein